MEHIGSFEETVAGCPEARQLSLRFEKPLAGADVARPVIGLERAVSASLALRCGTETRKYRPLCLPLLQHFRVLADTARCGGNPSPGAIGVTARLSAGLPPQRAASQPRKRGPAHPWRHSVGWGLSPARYPVF